ncbi:TetR/AcrR family transcriptional regulator [Nocardia cyriacigeorgica]|nr:TetR/AcrR family transcriptional regulator [Nocardia cyriacigeorgica]MBF6088281.1 TetR/AcrR family transcriptional regulator [Nocardia cyriacigeorgica]MBF6095388.1 TetR/AcrR family transcriptional regulator [Nocardia cyriacigeorgica]MBF6497390.1 TetR/AcrR family transcriptional regulator [Nocardia cyriacigeorgica]
MSAVSPARVYGGLTAEQRHDQRRARLIEAATLLLGTRGAAETTVTAVCAEAKLTSRYFYQHFSDRDALLRAVAVELENILRHEVELAAPADGAAPDEVARATVGAFVRMIADDPVMARILFIESAAEPVMRELRSEIMTRFTDLVLAHAQRYLHLADSTIAVAHLGSTLAVGGLFEVLRRWLDGELDFDAEQIIEHSAGLFGFLAAYVSVVQPD